jgi:hypothetical protein
LSAFLLRVFSHSIEKTGTYLKIIEPVVKYMLAKVDDNSLEREISTTWSTIVGLFKKLQKSLNYELLSCYRQTIVLAMLHLNMDISSTAFSILDMKDSVDDKSKMVYFDYSFMLTTCIIIICIFILIINFLPKYFFELYF